LEFYEFLGRRYPENAPIANFSGLTDNDVDKAVEVLRASSFAVMVTDVLCITCPNVPGSLSSVLEKLASNDVFIEYMYAFSDGDSANVVIRPTNVEAALKVLG
jgi:hypothetical protein